MTPLRLTVFVLGSLLLLISLVLFGFAALGFLGMLADVGPAQNRAMGQELLTYALWMNGGAILCVVFGRRRPKAEADSPK